MGLTYYDVVGVIHGADKLQVSLKYMRLLKFYDMFKTQQN